MLWGLPFVVTGQYLIWGRFLHATWFKKRTHYAVANRRVIVVQNAWQRKVASCYLDSPPALTKEGWRLEWNGRVAVCAGSNNMVSFARLGKVECSRPRRNSQVRRLRSTWTSFTGSSLTSAKRRVRQNPTLHI